MADLIPGALAAALTFAATWAVLDAAENPTPYRVGSAAYRVLLLASFMAVQAVAG